MGLWGTLVITVASGIGAYCASYLKEKGKNLATRQDIDDLTRRVEGIKMENAMLVERFKSQQQLRNAALDKRLEAHQRAFELWHGLHDNVLVPNMDREKVEKEIKQCFEWWQANCLYLEPEARKAFSGAYVSAWTLMANGGVSAAGYPTIEKLLHESETRIRDAGNIIMKAVALPGLTEAEADPFRDEKALAR